MNKRKRSLGIMMGCLAVLGILFMALAVYLFATGSRAAGAETGLGKSAYLGFGTVGLVYMISSLGMWLTTKSKKAMIEESDERAKTIEAKAGIAAFGVQTLLLFTALFILGFMGVLGSAAIIVFSGVGAVSVIVFVSAQIYLSSRM